MLYVKLTCGTCGFDFEIYHSEMNQRDHPIRCPHCLRQMRDRHWQNLIDAYMTAADWNREVLKSYLEFGAPRFEAEFMSKHVPHEMTLENLELEE